MWTDLGLVITNVNTSDVSLVDSGWLFDMVVSVEPSQDADLVKSRRRRHRRPAQYVNNINGPPGMPRAQINALTANFSFSQTGQQPCGEIDQLQEVTLVNALGDLFKGSLRILTLERSRLPSGVRKGGSFNHSLQATFPSVFLPAYTQAVAHRSPLVPAISKSLAAFRLRAGSALTEVEKSSEAHSLDQAAAVVYHRSADGFDLQLWSAMLSNVAVPTRVLRVPSMPFKAPKPETHDTDCPTTLLGPVTAGHGLQAEARVLTEQGNSDHDVCLPGSGADQAGDFDLYLLSAHTLEAADDEERCEEDTTHSMTSFEELVESQMLSISSSDEWVSYRDANTASSHSSTACSSLHGLVEESCIHEQGNQDTELGLWDEFIGPCGPLTQTLGREDPPYGDLITPGHLSPDCSEVYLEDLHISAAAFEKGAGFQHHAAVHTDGILCDLEPSQHCDLAKEPKRTPVSQALSEEDIDFSQLRPRHFHSTTWVSESDCSELFGPDGRIMWMSEGPQSRHVQMPSQSTLAHVNIRQSRGVQGRNGAQTGSGPEQQPSLRSSIKRSSTVSMLSSPESSPPKRQRSFLKRLSRSSSRASKRDESETLDFDMKMLNSRSMELKRRKTLEDYEVNDDQDDDEMLFV